MALRQKEEKKSKSHWNEFVGQLLDQEFWQLDVTFHIHQLDAEAPSGVAPNDSAAPASVPTGGARSPCFDHFRNVREERSGTLQFRVQTGEIIHLLLPLGRAVVGRVTGRLDENAHSVVVFRHSDNPDRKQTVGRHVQRPDVENQYRLFKSKENNLVRTISIAH